MDNGDPRPEDGAAAAQDAPKLMVERVLAGGHERDGRLISVCVETGSQGPVTLVLDALKVPNFIDVIAGALSRAHKASELAGNQQQRMMYPVQRFAVSSMDGVAGVLLTLNQDGPTERHYLLTDPQHAVSVAQMLIKQAGAVARLTTVINDRRRLILPGRNGK